MKFSRLNQTREFANVGTFVSSCGGSSNDSKVSGEFADGGLMIHEDGSLCFEILRLDVSPKA